MPLRRSILRTNRSKSPSPPVVDSSPARSPLRRSPRLRAAAVRATNALLSTEVVIEEVPTTPQPLPQDTIEETPDDMAEVDRDTSVACEALNTTFHPPSRFDDVDSLSQDNAYLFAYAPWFRRDVCTEHREVLDAYVDEDGRLPGGIPLAATNTRQRFCVANYLPKSLSNSRN